MNTTINRERERALEERLGISFTDKKLLFLALTHPSAVNEYPLSFSSSNQRVEFLGDGFIDFVVALELYKRLPEISEGELTELRSSVVRGVTLANVARNFSLGSFLYMGQGEEASGGRERDSNLAAALEALIGALLLDLGGDIAYGITRDILEMELTRTVRDGASKDPKSKLQEITQSMGKGSPIYSTVNESGQDHLRVFTIEVALEGCVIGVGSGHRKVDGERAAALEAIKSFDRTL